MVDPVEICDFCRLPCPEPPVTAVYDGVDYQFCSMACLEALEEAESAFTEYHGFRRVDLGVGALADVLPKGVQRNSMVLLSTQSGTRGETLQTELAWRTLRRGEPAVVASFLEPPISVVQRFLSLGWNVLPYLERGRFHVLDCFTYRVDNRTRMLDRMSAWNSHLQDVVMPETTTVRDPSDIRQVANQLDSCLEQAEMHNQGVVVLDSLTEFGSLVQPRPAYDFIKDVRADVCKGRFVPMFAGATGDDEAFPHSLEYGFDGVIDLRLRSDPTDDDTLRRDLLVRKMAGVPSVTRWIPYRFVPGEGLVERAVEASDAGGPGPARGVSPPAPGDRQTGATDGPQSRNEDLTR